MNQRGWLGMLALLGLGQTALACGSHSTKTTASSGQANSVHDAGAQPSTRSNAPSASDAGGQTTTVATGDAGVARPPRGPAEAAGTSGEGGTGSGARDAGAPAAAGSGGGPRTGCGAGDAKLPPEPTFPPTCVTLKATRTVADGAVPDEAMLDTQALQQALDGCTAGQAVKLTTDADKRAFITGPLTIPTGVTLWVDAGVTLFGTRDLNVYGSAGALITVAGASSGIVGDGVIDGQGGEPMVGDTQSFWDANGAGTGNNPALIQVRGAKDFTLYRITLHDSPKFHVKLGADGFVVWGVTVKTPGKSHNSMGRELTPSLAHNTDGIDPGEAASNGFIVCSKISVGDDHIAIKGSQGVDHLVIAHNHFGAGHGMSIGSEFQGGVSNVDVYDLSIDGTGTGLSGGSANGIRIKSDPSRGGLVTDISYRDVCVRELTNPIILTPKYSTATGTSIPQYKNILIQDFHALAGKATPKVTLDGYDADHANSVMLDNVVIEGISASNVSASYTDVTLGPGKVNFKPSGTQVTLHDQTSGNSQPNACEGKWVTF